MFSQQVHIGSVTLTKSAYDYLLNIKKSSMLPADEKVKEAFMNDTVTHTKLLCAGKNFGTDDLLWESVERFLFLEENN